MYVVDWDVTGFLEQLFDCYSSENSLASS